MKIRKIIGLAGVANTEKLAAYIWSKRFEYLMIVMAILLPLQWYLERHGELAHTFWYASIWFVWLLLLLETIVITALVKCKFFYLRENWLNLFILVVGFPLFWEYHTPLLISLRALQLLLMVRFLIPLWDHSVKILARNRLGTTLLVVFMITTFWGIVISLIDPAVKTASDGIWLAWETVTTVGYGDVIPSSILGRFLALGLMLTGVALISLLTANFSAYFIKQSTDPIQTKEDELLRTLQVMQVQLTQIQNRLNQLESTAKN